MDERYSGRRIVILGNRTFDDGVLKSKMSTEEVGILGIFNKPRFRMDFLRRDIETIRSFYRKNGFFDADVSISELHRDEKKNEVRIRIVIDEGERTRVRSLEILDHRVVPEERMREALRLREGEPYNPNLVNIDRKALFDLFFERDYLGTRVSSDITVDSTSVDIRWKIRVGKKAKIRDIAVTGNEDVKDELVLRELKVKKGELFDLEKVQRSKQNLYNTGFFSSVEIEPENLDLEEGLVSLNIRLRERKTGYLETGMGVGNVHASHVFAEWGQRNLLGRGYWMKLRSSYSFSVFADNEFDFSRLEFEKRYQRHEGEIRFPHILSTWNTFSVGAFYEYDATIEPAVVKAMSYTGSVSRQFSRETSILLGFVYENVKRDFVIEERDKSIKKSLEFKYRRDTRNFYFNPEQGRYLNLELRYSGGLLGGDDNYYSVVSSHRRYYSLLPGMVLAYRLRAGYSEAFAETRKTGLPIESRFFLGGGNSVRGYRENSVGPFGPEGEPRGGRVLLLSNIEIRYMVPYLSRYNIGGVVFLDGGNVWSSVDDISINQFGILKEAEDVSARDFKYSAGFGFRYYTPLGPIRIDAGFPVNKAAYIEDDYWIHISLGQVF